MEYEAVIGLEVHVQLKTESKMFTRVAYRYGEPPNSLTNPLIMGLPGTLPVINRDAVAMTVKVGLMFSCEITDVCKWDRKNYFYPDQPKNYQISQYDQPICRGGEVEIELPGPSRNVMGEHRCVRLNRIHLEEDAGKLTHSENYSLVDFNRSGAPLLEIVTEPDMHSAEEVYSFLTSLKTHMVYAQISDCDMEKGQLRCDANTSVRPRGSSELGNKVELKNLNSISGVRNGVEYEIERQIRVNLRGETVPQETRHWNAEEGFSVSLRTKEEAHDYRYFPDPDLMPVKISAEWREEIREGLGELPFEKQRRFTEEYTLPYTVTSVICPDRELCDYFEAAVQAYNKPREISNFVANDLLRELSAAGDGGNLPLSDCKVDAKDIAQLVRMIDDHVISKQIAQEVFVEMFNSGDAPDVIVERKGLQQTSDAGELEKVCSQAIAENPKPVEQFKAGKENAINALKGHVMKATRGRANPALVDEILRGLLSS